MQFTNKYGLLRPIARALASDDYEHHGDYSLTELLKSPQQVQLTRRYPDKIVVEVMNNVWSLMGRAMHYVMSLAKIKGSFIEERFIFVLNGSQISCQSDYVYPLMKMIEGKAVEALVNGKRVYGIIDFKNTSHWAAKDGVKDEWEEQINGYIFGWHQRGINITQGHIAAFLRDWSYTDAVVIKKRDYPPQPIKQMPIRLWPLEQTESFLKQRLKLHMEAAQLHDKDIPPCTEKERWAKPDKFSAVFVGGNSKGNAASGGSFFRDRARCDQFMIERRLKNTLKTPDEDGNPRYKKGFIDTEAKFTKGSSPKCERYCDCRDFCPQYARMNRKRPF